MRNAIQCDTKAWSIYANKNKDGNGKRSRSKKSSVGTENDLLSKSTHDQHNAYTEYW